MNIRGINHLLFSVSDLENSIKFYEAVVSAKLLVKGRTTAYFNLKGIWLALNEERNIVRGDIKYSYTHIAFSIDEEDFDEWTNHLKQLKVTILPGRMRDEKDKRSIYFTDPDGHKFELHTGNLQERLTYYKEEKSHMEFYY